MSDAPHANMQPAVDPRLFCPGCAADLDGRAAAGIARPGHICHVKHLRNCGRQVAGDPGCFCTAVAHHEAGHAVAALVLGVRIDSLAIHDGKGDGDASGRMNFQGTGDVREHLVTLAGPAAERLAVGFLDGAEADDVRSVRAAMDAAAAGVLMALAEVIVASHWPAVTRLVETLADRPEMNGHDLRKLLRGLLVPTPERKRWRPIPEPVPG
jgi:hypothetical protein